MNEKNVLIITTGVVLSIFMICLSVMGSYVNSPTDFRFDLNITHEADNNTKSMYEAIERVIEKEDFDFNTNGFEFDKDDCFYNVDFDVWQCMNPEKWVKRDNQPLLFNTLTYDDFDILKDGQEVLTKEEFEMCRNAIIEVAGINKEGRK